MKPIVKAVTCFVAGATLFVIQADVAGAKAYTSGSKRKNEPYQTASSLSGWDRQSHCTLHQRLYQMIFTKGTMWALEDSVGIQHIGLATDNKELNLILLNSVGKDWEAVFRDEEEFYTTYPAYLNLKSGPKLSVSNLEAMHTKIVAISQLLVCVTKFVIHTIRHSIEIKMIKICSLI
jgi:hypothetical protein